MRHAQLYACSVVIRRLFVIGTGERASNRVRARCVDAPITEANTSKSNVRDALSACQGDITKATVCFKDSSVGGLRQVCGISAIQYITCSGECTSWRGDRCSSANERSGRRGGKLGMSRTSLLPLFAVAPTEAPMTDTTEMAMAIQRFVLQHVTSSVEAGDGGGGHCTGDDVCSAGLVSVCAGWIPGLYWPADSGGPTADSGTAVTVTPVEYATVCI
jgi:hypothetical protein